jgi:hypothetical protein
LPSAPHLTLGRASCAECPSWTLGKVFLFFLFCQINFFYFS